METVESEVQVLGGYGHLLLLAAEIENVEILATTDSRPPVLQRLGSVDDGLHVLVDFLLPFLAGASSQFIATFAILVCITELLRVNLRLAT